MRARPGTTAILSAIWTASSASLAAIVLAVLTSKIIALHAGLEGIALVGMFRSLGGVVSGALALGSGTVLMARVSNASSTEEAGETVSAFLLLLLLQLPVVAVTALFFADPIARWLFGESAGGRSGEVRLVLIMGFVNLALQTLTAVLRGQGNLKQSARVQLATAFASLLFIFPLLSLGGAGLAVNVGSGSLVGAGLAAFYIWRAYGSALIFGSLARRWALLRKTLRPSLQVTFQSVVLIGSALAVNSVVNKHYGLQNLGAYNAATMVLDTAVIILMSAMRSYLLPQLGKLQDASAKDEFFSQMLATMLILATAAAIPMIFGSKYIVWALFSKQFADTGALISIYGLAMIGQVLVWSFNTFLLHKNDVAVFVALDSLWALGYVASALMCAKLGLPLEAVVWSFVLTSFIHAGFYALLTVRAHGAGLFNGQSARLAGQCLLIAGSGYALSSAGHPLIGLLAAGSIAAGAAAFQRPQKATC